MRKVALEQCGLETPDGDKSQRMIPVKGFLRIAVGLRTWRK